MNQQLDRRDFIRHTAAGLAGASLLPAAFAEDKPGRPLKVAAIYTEFRLRSHAFNILENFLEPPLFNGKWLDPGMQVVSFYADQSPEKDLTPSVARQYKVPVFKTIGEALTLGGKELAVDAVLSIGEHGDYPVNDRGVREYPRKRFFDEIVAVFKKSNRGVPLFNDKHLSYRWDWAKEMYDTCAALKVPLMAGSSVPLAERRPALELPRQPKFVDAVSIHGGPYEVYDFHALEVLQSFVEFRPGGETGVKQVQFLEGEALWKAADEGLWSESTADAAMAAELGPGQPTLRKLVRTEPFSKAPHWGVLVTYKDGFRAVVLKIGEKHTRWNFACRLEGEKQPRATSYYVGPWGNRNLFMALSHAIQVFFRDKQSPYPVERTLLVSGVLASAVDSRVQKGKAVQTPHLHLGYRPRDFKAVREMGDSWKVITEKTPQPTGLKKQF
jgi:hypothetical protein